MVDSPSVPAAPGPPPNSRWSASEVAGRAFGIVRRGFDPEEVRDFLEMLARELAAAERREQELREELAAAMEQVRHPVLDEGALTSALGQRSAAVLRGAHEEAARIAQQAEERAAGTLRDAQQHATDVQVSAESASAERIAEAELEANALRQQAKEEAAAVLEASRVEGESLVARAREQGRSMLDQAQEARRRVLADMAQRRRLMTEQIEQFRAARDQVAGSVVGVRRSLDRIVDDLSRADDAARAAAAEAAHPHAPAAPEAVLVEEAERAAAELGADTGATVGAVDGTTGSVPHVAAGGPSTTPGGVPPSVSLRFDDIATIVSRPAEGAGPEEIAGPDPLDSVGDVEELFARLRAQHEPDEGGIVVVGEGTSDGAAGDEAAGHDSAGDEAVGRDSAGDGSARHDSAGDGSAGHDSARDGSGATGSTAKPDGPVDETSERSEGQSERDEPDVESPDSASLAQRAVAIEPIVTTMARRLKRALQDDQNRLLDRLRKGTGEWTDELLVDETSQRALYAKAATASVRDSLAAGAAFARSHIGGRQPRAAAPDQHTVDAVAGELASTIVALLRRRLEGAEIPDAAERIGAAYREWRGERIERLAEDRAVEAFDAGVLAGAARSDGVRWVRSETVPGCADCEDNALAGSVAPGEEFPTGHRHPPAHPGCRCLLVPTAP